MLPSVKYTFDNEMSIQVNTGLISLYGVEVAKKYDKIIIKIKYLASLHSKELEVSYASHNLYMALENNVFDISDNINIFTELGINYSYDEVEKSTIDAIVASGFQAKWDNLMIKIGINISVRDLFNVDDTVIHNYYGDPVFVVSYNF